MQTWGLLSSHIHLIQLLEINLLKYIYILLVLFLQRTLSNESFSKSIHESKDLWHVIRSPALEGFFPAHKAQNIQDKSGVRSSKAQYCWLLIWFSCIALAHFPFHPLASHCRQLLPQDTRGGSGCMTSRTLCSAVVGRCLWCCKPARLTGFRDNYNVLLAWQLLLSAPWIAPRPLRWLLSSPQGLGRGRVLCKRHRMMRPSSHDSNCRRQPWNYCLKTWFLSTGVLRLNN